MTPSARPRRSAGLLLHRERDGVREVWIAHMGGPFWRGKQTAAWSIPKGEFDDPDEDALTLARREFAEEMGTAAPDTEYTLLGEFRQRSGKVVVVFAGEAEFEPDAIRSNTFSMEWPPRSGRMIEVPEVDDARWVPLDAARELLVTGQVGALDALLTLLGDHREH